MGFLISLVAKTVFYRVKKWAEHVRWMQKLAGGTLAIDAEADYWRKLIKDKTYRPIWRWYYARVWDEKHPGGVRDRKPTSKKVKIFIIVVVILIALILLLSTFGLPGLGGEIHTKTKMTIVGLANFKLYNSNIYGWTVELNGTGDPLANYSYPGGFGMMLVEIERTDSAYSDATIFLNVTSDTFRSADETTTYISGAEYYGVDPNTGKTELIVNLTGDGQQYGYFFTVPDRGSILLLIILYFRAFDSYYYNRYVTLKPYGGDDSSVVYIWGGYYRIGLHGPF